MSDLHFAVGAARTILKKAEEGWPVYAYSFEHYNKKVFETLPEQLRGSTHTNEYVILFFSYFLKKTFLEYLFLVSTRIKKWQIRYSSHFFFKKDISDTGFCKFRYPYMFNIFIFGKYDIDSDPQEVAVKNLFRNSLISFVKNGRPQPGADIDWPSVAATDSAKDIKFIRFLPQPSIGKGFHHGMFIFCFQKFTIPKIFRILRLLDESKEESTI